MTLSPLSENFYARPVLAVARNLLGTRLVKKINGQRVGGFVIETEAYEGESDLACHARAGRTARTEVMYGPPGKAYVYFIYGMHWMLNAVAAPEGFPAAVLIRAILPTEGLDIIAERREGIPARDYTNGPARLCQALDINGQWNGSDLTDERSDLVIEPGLPVPNDTVKRSARVGIDRVPEPWRSVPWRFRVDLQSWNLPAENNRV